MPLASSLNLCWRQAEAQEMLLLLLLLLMLLLRPPRSTRQVLPRDG